MAPRFQIIREIVPGKRVLFHFGLLSVLLAKRDSAKSPTFSYLIYYDIEARLLKPKSISNFVKERRRLSLRTKVRLWLRNGTI